MNFFKLKVEITQETYANYKLLMGFFRFNGLLPVSLRRAGRKISMQFSLFYLSLWWIIAGFFVCTTFLGITHDIRSKGASIMKEVDTDKLMILVQTCQYATVAVVAIFVNPLRFGKLFRYVKCINEIDFLIKTTYITTEKKTLLLMTTLLVLYNAAFTAYYIRGCYGVFGKSIGLIEVLKRYSSLSVVIYFTWTSEYFNMILLRSLKVRISKLKQELMVEYKALVATTSHGGLKGLVPGRVVNGRVTIFRTHKKNDALTNLSQVYMKLMGAADDLNGFLNVGLLITIAAVFWSLIYVLYGIMVNLAHGRGDVGRKGELISVYIQFGATCVRALMIVNPAHDCLLEVEKIKAVVCRMLSCRLSRKCRKQLDALAILLGLRQLQFSACGFLVVDRFLLPSLIDTITTIIVVLYQYRSAIQINF